MFGKNKRDVVFSYFLLDREGSAGVEIVAAQFRSLFPRGIFVAMARSISLVPKITHNLPTA